MFPAALFLLLLFFVFGRVNTLLLPLGRRQFYAPEARERGARGCVVVKAAPDEPVAVSVGVVHAQCLVLVALRVGDGVEEVLARQAIWLPPKENRFLAPPAWR